MELNFVVSLTRTLSIGDFRSQQWKQIINLYGDIFSVVSIIIDLIMHSRSSFDKSITMDDIRYRLRYMIVDSILSMTQVEDTPHRYTIGMERMEELVDAMLSLSLDIFPILINLPNPKNLPTRLISVELIDLNTSLWLSRLLTDGTPTNNQVELSIRTSYIKEGIF